MREIMSARHTKHDPPCITVTCPTVCLSTQATVGSWTEGKALAVRRYVPGYDERQNPNDAQAEEAMA